ncbi:MAG: hypothetical protein COU10_01850 [Candidatus Harrisonbacteria bacterium CG10_big_fil_rev_8_21_14_0_10_45_28]|uniref:DUF11 domain-containing protein n=1 Tax=Candidatus Harrisonbacteria bacterium CG10_big_fil_rev_8_21_14_0_10_45_28 TaxID=1974586 RepID=A0A2H0UQ99_9BACT|nr:MAG: hypothetical protein COU10_01850 [Candidatus Harrisonbacteria bacterium CG10_big_fil_rev_8_21_14_0_10_45_28]
MDEFKDPILNQPLTQDISEPTAIPTKKKNKLKFFIILGVILVVVILAVVLIFNWIRLSNTKGVAITVLLPETTIQAGIPFSISVQINNNSNVDLSDPELSITLPEGLRFLNQNQQGSLVNIKLEAIPTGQTKESRIELLALGTNDTIAQLKASLSYLPGTLTSRFEKATTVDIVAAQSPLSLDITVPSQILSGESYQTTLSFTNNSNQTFYGPQLEYLYPAGYNLISSSQEPDKILQGGGYSWQFGEIKPGDSEEVVVQGNYLGLESSAFDISAQLNVQYNNQMYVVARKTAPISVAQSPLAISVSIVNQTKEAVLSAGQSVQYELNYRNNTDVNLKDVIITANLTGAMLDLSSVESTGYLQGADTVIFNASRAPELAIVPPGKTGRVAFSVKLRDDFPIINTNSKNYSVGIKAKIESPTVPNFVSGDSTVGFAQISNNIVGKIELFTKGYYRDPTSRLANSGPVPPIVGQPTTYTIHWILKNYATDVVNVSVKAFLGPNVRFTGQAESTTGVLPQYNTRTQEMTWDIIKIPATKGVISAPTEATFQVELTPSVSQVGQSVKLIEKTFMTATDQFVSQPLTATADIIDSKLKDDPTVVGKQGEVAN